MKKVPSIAANEERLASHPWNQACVIHDRSQCNEAGQLRQGCLERSGQTERF